MYKTCLPRIKTKIRLIGEIVSVEYDFDKVSLRYKGLRLFNFSTKQAWFLSVGHVRFSVTVNYLPTKTGAVRIITVIIRR